MFRLSLITLLLSFIGSFAFASGSGGAGIVFSPSLFYNTDTYGSTSPTTTTTTIIDARLGYETSSEWYFGGYYETKSFAAGSAATLNHSEMGVDVGYFFGNGFRLIATYLLSVSDDLTASSKDTGTGFLVNVGWAIPVGSWAFVPELTYYSLSYDTQVTNGASSTLANKVTDTGIRPTFGFKFHF